MRLSSVTHSFNMNQRFLELTPAAGPTATTLSLTIANNPNECPPGHYMLFLLDANGTPSHASIVAVNTNVCTSALSITQSDPSPEQYNPCERITRFTVVGGNAGSTYHWTVNGVATSSTSGNFIDLTTSTTAPTVQVAVEVAGNSGCGASSSLTSYFHSCSEAQ